MQFWYGWHMNLNLFGFPIFKLENLFNNKTAVDTLYWIVKISQLEHRVKSEYLIDLINETMTDRLYSVLHVAHNSRRHRPTFTWDELFLINESIAMKIWNLGQQYGYKYDWDYQSFKDNLSIKYNQSFRENPGKYIHYTIN